MTIVTTSPPPAPAPTGAERPRRADAVRNRELVLTAAEALFADRGMKVQLDEVAAAAGVGVGTVCRNFATKDELLDEVLNRARRGLIERAQECLAVEDAGAGFRRFVVGLVEFQSRYRALAEEMAARPNPTPDSTSLRQQTLDMITALVRRAQDAGALRADLGSGDVAVLFAGIAHASTLTAHLDRDQRDRYLTVLLDGLRPAGASPLPGRPIELTDLIRR